MEAFPVPVLNEREVRAGAGILFAAAFVAFFQAFHMGDFTMMRLVVLAVVATVAAAALPFIAGMEPPARPLLAPR